MGGSVKRFTACLLALCLLTSQLGISFSDGVVVSAENTQTADEKSTSVEASTDENKENDTAATAAETVEETAVEQSAADFIAEDAAQIAAAGSLEEARTLLDVSSGGMELESASDEAGMEAAAAQVAGTEDETGDAANGEENIAENGALQEAASGDESAADTEAVEDNDAADAGETGSGEALSTEESRNEDAANAEETRNGDAADDQNGEDGAADSTEEAQPATGAEDGDSEEGDQSAPESEDGASENGAQSATESEDSNPAEEKTEDAEDAADPDSQENLDAVDEDNENAAPEEGAVSDVENDADTEADSEKQDAANEEASGNLDAADEEASDDLDAVDEKASDEDAVDAENIDEETSAALESEEAMADSLTAEDGEALEEEDKEPVIYEAETSNGIIVSVVAPGGVLPDDITLVAALIGSSEDQSRSASAVGEALDEHNISYDGYVAIDVHFEDGTGTEVEPDGAVAVSFSLPEGLLPEGAQNLEVQHLKEDGNGNVTEVETVAAETENLGQISMDGAGQVVAEFEVEGFSSFTITYDRGSGSQFDLELNLVFLDKSDVSITQSTIFISSSDFSTSSSTTPSDVAEKIKDYVINASFSYAALAKSVEEAVGGSADKITVLFCNSGGWRFSSGKHSGTSNKVTDQTDYSIYFVYTAATAELPAVYYYAGVNNAPEVSEAASFTLNKSSLITVSDLTPQPTDSAFTGLSYTAVIAESSSEAIGVGVVNPSYLYYDNSTWYYSTEDTIASGANIDVTDGTWTAFPTGASLYFVYPEIVTVSATLIYEDLSGSNSEDSEKISISLVTGLETQVNKMDLTDIPASGSYYNGKEFSYAVISDSAANASASSSKVTWLKYDNDTLYYSTDDTTITGGSISWSVFDSSSMKLYFLYYSISPSVKTTGTNNDSAYNTGTYTFQADQGVSKSDFITYWAENVTGYTCTDVAIIDGNSYVSVYRVMYASKLSEEAASAGWYYRPSSDNDSWKSFSISNLCFVYTKNDISITYNNGTDYPDGADASTIAATTVTSAATVYTLAVPTTLTGNGTDNNTGTTYYYQWTGWAFSSLADYDKSIELSSVTWTNNNTTPSQTITVPNTVVVENDTIQLYSTYTKSALCTVTFEWEDSEKVPSDVSLPYSTSSNSVSVAAGEEISLSSYSTYENDGYVKGGVKYTWKGWYYKDSGNNLVKVSDSVYKVNESIALIGLWSAVDTVSLELYTNFEMDSSEQGSLIAYFNSTSYGGAIGGYTSDGTVSGSVSTDLKSIVDVDEKIGTIEIGGTITLPTMNQGDRVTDDSYLFSGWKIMVTTESGSETFDLGDYVNDYGAPTSATIDSDTGIKFWLENGVYNITVPKGKITIQASLFKETNSWTAQYNTQDLLKIERTSVDFSSTTAYLGSVKDIEVYVYDLSKGDWSDPVKLSADNLSDGEFYFSYSKLACVDLIATPYQGYSIVQTKYTVCFGSNGPNTSGWTASGKETTINGKEPYYFDNVQDTCTLEIYLAKVYEIDFQVVDTSGAAVSGALSNSLDTIYVSPVGVAADITGCSLTGTTGHDSCTSENSSTAVNKAKSMFESSSTYCLNTSLTISNPNLSSIVYTSVKGWNYGYSGPNSTGTALTDFSISSLSSIADSNGVIMLTAIVSAIIVPTEASTDTAPYMLLFGTGTAAGVVLLAAGWKNKRRRRVLSGELDEVSRVKRGRKDVW
ncbi:MAG: hypothetical protein LUH58_09590 [Lachnospiraceae bacterium]|nr:hypothetical protein [Lachnospiraceae bacterium]